MASASKLVDVFTKRQRIAELAGQSPEMGFTSLAGPHRHPWLHRSPGPVRTVPPGVDGQTGEDYAGTWRATFQSLLDRAKSGTYRASGATSPHPQGRVSSTRPDPSGFRP